MIKQFLGASTSIEIGNNNKIYNDVKKNTINDDADKTDLEKCQKAGFKRRHRSRGLFVTLVGSGSQLAELATNLGNLRRLFQTPELNCCTLAQNR